MFALMDSPLPSMCDDVDVEDDARFLCDLVNFANRCAGEDVRIDYEKISRSRPSERFAAALAEARKSGLVPPEMPEAFIRQLVHVGRGQRPRAAKISAKHRYLSPCSFRAGNHKKHWPRLSGARRQRRGSGLVATRRSDCRAASSSGRPFHHDDGRSAALIAANWHSIWRMCQPPQAVLSRCEIASRLIRNRWRLRVIVDTHRAMSEERTGKTFLICAIRATLRAISNPKSNYLSRTAPLDSVCYRCLHE